ncbi:MAG: helix-turn-helix transcriptional regulator, partial [Acidobacteriaceae bacterium]|nr:helix-turn-helix transcriptional regulator [Acidobacteriaceae bacterium]
MPLFVEPGRMPSCALARVIVLVHESYADGEVSLKSISRKVNISDRHLGRLFTRCTGFYFREYLRELRIHRAGQLLKSEGYSLKEIAVMVGYNGISHFGQEFRRSTGITPSQFRGAHTAYRSVA